MSRFVVSLVVLAACAPFTHAQDEATRSAWEAVTKAQVEYKKAASAASQVLREDIKAGVAQAEAQKKFREAVGKPQSAMMRAREAFIAAFAKSDWGAWDAQKDGALLETGLAGAAQLALKKGDLARARQAHGMLLEKLPKSKTAANSQLMIGDLYAAEGNIEAARKQYEKVAGGGDDRMKKYAEQRLLIGTVAPDIASNEWIGGEAKKLSDLKGKVVVVDFWATWCGPCRVVMPGLSEMYSKHKDQGLVILGLTRFYNYGYMPANPQQMLTGGKTVKGISEQDFAAHVKAFRDNTKLSYPFVIGEKSNFTDYKVIGIPSVAVIDGTGKIALLAVGSGSEPLVRAVVERELKKINK